MGGHISVNEGRREREALRLRKRTETRSMDKEVTPCERNMKRLELIFKMKRRYHDIFGTNSTVEDFYRYENTSFRNGYYHYNNFENLFISGVTLFELTVVVMTIVVAFILEAFLFRIQYKRVGNVDSKFNS
uniref:Uncharacterized protein n=1 Tax=Strigamia maritima TaxID=126957 RepID=T1II00_STRMM